MMRFIIRQSLALLLCAGVLHAAGVTRSTPGTKVVKQHTARIENVPVWIDTDIGGDIDDALCLLCAIHHPRIEVVGVSTVQGCIGSVRAATWVARTLLDRAGLNDIPVLPGSRGRLNGGGAYDERGSYGILAPKLEPLPATPEADNARIDTIAAAMRRIGKPFYVIAVGPLSNLARLTRRHPDLAQAWKGVICMAGTLADEAECNVRLDADAAGFVAEKLHPRFVGVEAMGRAIPRELVEAAADERDPAAAFFLECYRQYRLHTAPPGEAPDKRRLTISDAVTLLSLTEVSLFRFESLRLSVEKNGRLRRTPDGPVVEYAVGSGHEAVEEWLLSLLAGRVPARTESGRVVLTNMDRMLSWKRRAEGVYKARTGREKAWGVEDIPPFPRAKGKILYIDDFAALDNWRHEGIGKLTTPEPGGMMQLNCIGSRQGGRGCMAFCKRNFPDDILIEYDMQALSSKGLLITFIAFAARETGKDPLRDLPERKGIFADYVFNGKLRCYHVSVSRYSDKGEHTGVSNWRRNPGLFLMAHQKDLCKTPRTWYHVAIAKRRNVLEMTVNGELAGGFHDLEEIPDQIPKGGKVGFRAIGADVRIRIRGFRVTALE